MNTDDRLPSNVYKLFQQLKDPSKQTKAEKKIIMLVLAYPQVAQFGIGSTTMLHFLCASQATFLTVKTVYDAYPNAIMADCGDGLPLHVACRKASPVDVIAFLVNAYPSGISQLGDGRSPLSLAIQNHPLRRHLLSILSCPKTISSLGPIRMEWNVDTEFLLDGFRAFTELVKPTRLNVRICRGMTASSLSLENRHAGTLSVHAWFLPHLIESVLLEIGKICGASTNLFIDYFEGLDEGLVRGIAGVPSLERLSMCRCSTDEQTVRSLLQELSKKPNFIHLQMTRMDAIPGRSFEHLPCLRSLEYLSVSGTPVDSDIAVPISQLLRTTQSLKELNIGQTRIDRDGVGTLIAAIRQNDTLTRLELTGLLGASEKVRVLLESINCKLEHVIVGMTDVNREAIEYYCALNKSGRSVTREIETTKSQYITILSNVNADIGLLFGLLRENPAKWVL